MLWYGSQGVEAGFGDATYSKVKACFEARSVIFKFPKSAV